VDLDTAAQELYGLAPSEFTKARDRKVAEARLAGDRALAAAIKGLRRPTAGAWLANVLARESSERIDELLKLGSSMRQAQTDLDGGDLRRLSLQRQKLVPALVDDAVSRVRTSGSAVNDAAVRELTSTLEAALASAEAGETLRSGLLNARLQYSGFGSVDLSDAVAGPRTDRAQRSSKADPKPPKASPRSSPEKRGGAGADEARARLKSAQQAESLAERELHERKQLLEVAVQTRSQVHRQVVDAEKRMQKLLNAEQDAEVSVQEAKRARDSADDHLRSARDELTRAKSALGE
jgi:hypothetical protein